MIFNQIALELTNSIYRDYAFSLTKNKQDAEDLINDIVVVVHDKVDVWAKAVENDCLRKYLFTAIKNRFISIKRKEKDIDRDELLKTSEYDDGFAGTAKGKKILEKIQEDQGNDSYYPLLYRRIQEYGGVLNLSEATGVKKDTLYKGYNKYKSDLNNIKKILLIGKKDTGVGYHRIAKPYSELRETRNDILVTMSNGYINRDHDIVIFNRVIGKNYEDERAIFREMKLAGQKIIIDIDDHWVLPPGHLLEQHYMKENLTQRIMKNIQESDLVTTTNEVLALKILPLNKNVVVIPNALNESDLQWKPVWQPEGDRYRFGYFGSAAHTNDVPILRKACNLIHRERQNYQLKLIGFSPDEPATHAFEEVFTSRYTCPTGSYVRVDKVSVMAYGGVYNFIDCALAPLADNLFNRCKSNLKILEAAAHKLPIICSKIHPYYGSDFDDCVFFAESEYDWYKNMKLLIKDPQRGREFGNRAYKIFLENYTYKKVNKLRNEII